MSYEILNPQNYKVIGYFIFDKKRNKSWNIVEMDEWDKEHGADFRLCNNVSPYTKVEGKVQNNPAFKTFLVKICPNTTLTYMLMDDNENWDPKQRIYLSELSVLAVEDQYILISKI